MAGCPVVWNGVYLPPYLRWPLPVWMLDEYAFIFRRQCFTLRRMLALLDDDKEARDVVKAAARGRLRALSSVHIYLPDNGRDGGVYD